jgi:hypothetical protein
LFDLVFFSSWWMNPVSTWPQHVAFKLQTS